MVRLKTAAELDAMREAGRVVARVLQTLGAAAVPGMQTATLDRMADEMIVAAGGIASFRGVPAPKAGVPAYPAASCISINEEVVHGLPSGRELRSGDIVSIDVGVILDGWHGDATVTVGVGDVSDEAQRLLAATREALYVGISQMRAGGWLGDVSAAIAAYAESQGYSVVRDYTGHGIGREMHEGFQVPNFGRSQSGLKLRPGLTMAIEPMLNVGTAETKVLANGWTVVTADGKLSAHFEHTAAVTNGEPLILTTL
ncbi:MAG: type I methionyl aminopeptidase [Anaerolineae bacterium]